ncbi:serine hydrolase domain-containing protein [Stackebrandtia nassauensis]|uniref:Beta-lactamase n=1 Tax=Stackebrandtia nassauensis (strain DSM 44728 / CIP 108903 / NRRL B-16338 / NBRC 102104 / LLR-40K-21) TaxID=446470 RepID=D3PWZ9_STANL|nr:serine hydrolase domain-containing protein [Stackebrandtia nassauensis]ADD45223.1 beta-lactamase [Stackebrandtia nassauensis DSM 44728]
MKRIVIAVAAAALLVTPGVAAAKPHSGLDERSVDAFVGEYLENAGVKGVTVAVTKGTDVVVAKGYGTDSTGAELTGEAPMPIASLSKSFTALAVMRLSEQGKVDLDAPVREYLSEFTMDDPRAKRITVRQLLNQTSGMSDGTFSEKVEAQPSDLAGSVSRLADAELATAPGKSWNYHNPNFHVAARLVEKVSGEPFGEYLDTEVFAPLGMTKTSTVDVTDDAKLPRGHFAAYGQRAAAEPHRFVNGSDGIISTAEDMANWLAVNNGDGGELVSAKGFAELHEPSDPRGRYALGWNVGKRDGATVLDHGGVWFTYTARQLVIPETGYGFAVMANTGMSMAADVPYDLTEGLMALSEGDQPSTTDSPQSTNDLVLGLLTLAAIGWAAWRWYRSGVWARRRVDRPLWRNVLAGSRALFPALVLLSYPWLAGLVAAGRTATWTEHLYVWFPMLVWLSIATLGGLLVTGVRAVRLVRLRRSRATT